jgi:hypothetical protein
MDPRPTSPCDPHTSHIYPVSLFLSGDDYYLQCLWSQSWRALTVFCHKGQQQQVFFCVCQVFFETAIICKVTLLSLIQNRPSGVCRNDQFGADQGGRGRKGVKEISPPSPNFCLQEAMTLLIITVWALRFRVLGFMVLMTDDYSCLRFRV